MDQGSLVNEQIEAGALLAHSFDQAIPLQSAFWLKENEGDQWYLYLASDKIDDSNVPAAYSEVLRIVPPGANLWLDPFQVKVVGKDNPIARDVLEMQHAYPIRRITRLRNQMIGGISVDEMYLYPIPAAASV